MAPSDPNVIYVGEGEQTVRGNVSSGNGLWKTTDAGVTWSFLGLKEPEHIGHMEVHPNNPNILYVAAMGNLWKPNAERGVYRTKDGGKTWEKILFVSDKAGAVDITLDPNNARIIYASTWQIKRNGYRMDSGGPDSHLWKSVDGGDHWEQITDLPGLPKGVLGIIGVTVSPINSDRVWAIIDAEDGGVFRSDDGAKTWKKTSSNRALRQRAWYYSRIYADTENEDRVYVLNVGFWRSNDGGTTFERNDKKEQLKFEIIKDPRLPNTDEDYKKQLDFLLAVRDRVSEAHQAMIDIASVREDIEYIQKKLKDKSEFKNIIDLSTQLEKDMSVIENKIHMTKNKSRQDPLNYGIRINNRLAFLMADQQKNSFIP